MDLSPPTTLTSKYQATIPLAVRKRLGLKKGDSVRFEMRGNGEVVLNKIPSFDPEELAYLKLIEANLAEEWNSPEDDEHFKDL